MTAIAIWFNEEVPGNPTIWVAGDSKVSKDSRGALLIDDALKVAALPVMCRKPNAAGFFADLFYANTLGYAFAGSTLLGHNIYLALAPLLSNISSPTGCAPSLSDLVLYVKKYLQLSLETYVLNAVHPNLEIAIFGYCPVQHELGIYRLRIDGGPNGAEVTCEKMTQTQVTYLGTSAEAFQPLLDKSLLIGQGGQRNYRAPADVIRALIANGDFPGIGGDIQLGYASIQGFTPMALCKPYVKGEGRSYFSYLGRPLERQIGDAFIGIPAMAGTFSV